MKSRDQLLEEGRSQYGDVWEHVEGSRWYMEFCWSGGSRRFGLARAGIAMAPWWAKKLVVSVRFRSDSLEGNVVGDGVITVFYRSPRQTLGPYFNRSRPMTRAEYLEHLE